MKKYLGLLLLTAFLFCGMPVQAAGVPQGTAVNTILGDSKYVDPAWMNQNVVITMGKAKWIMPISQLAPYGVTIANTNGTSVLGIADTAVIDVFLNAINAQLITPTATSTPIYNNGKGSFISYSGAIVSQLNPNVKTWILNTLGTELLAGKPRPLTLELTAAYLTAVPTQGALTYSPDYVLAGTCTTSYSGSSSNRINNLQVASSRLNNLVVMPGQVVSISTQILPRTEANGYKSAGAYSGGKTIQATGGGICQVSSTCYNAVMNAGLGVIERHPHSMPVHYLPLGLDAAISSGSKDMRFVNTYPSPVILQAGCAGKNLTVNVLVRNEDLAGRSYRLWAQSTGSLSATSYLTTYVNGVEVGTVPVANSRYNPHS